jgi:hypothetical protein
MSDLVFIHHDRRQHTLTGEQGCWGHHQQYTKRVSMDKTRAKEEERNQGRGN